jgi:hypothetical protein
LICNGHGYSSLSVVNQAVIGIACVRQTYSAVVRRSNSAAIEL